MIAAAREYGIKRLVKIMYEAYKTVTVPLVWQKGAINLIFRIDEKTLCHNTKGISLLSHAE